MKTDADKLRSFLKQVTPTLETYGKKSIVSEIDKAITTTEDSATVLFCVPGIFFWVSSANSLGAVSRYSSNFALITVT